MSAALQAIERLRVMTPAARLAQSLPDPQRLALTAARRDLAEGDAVPPAGDVLERLAADLRTLFAPGAAARAASLRQLRDAPWVLWRYDLAGLPGLLNAVLAAADSRPALLRRLIRAWLRDADPGLPATRDAGRRIAALLVAQEDQRLLPWAKAHRRFALLNPERGPQMVARALMTETAPVAEILAAAALDEPIVQDGAYARAVVGAVLDSLVDALSRPEAHATWRRATDLLAPGARLRVVDAVTKGSIADAALLAWADGREPEPGLREEIQRFLLRHLGDPRQSPSAWQAVSPRAQAVFRRWLAADTLEAFFAVIDRHADPHWRYRRAFWLAALRKGAIADAWLVLGRAVAATARATLRGKGAFGELTSGGGDRAALLIRIGDFTFAEWSHSGRLRAWPSTAPIAPQLFRDAYTPEQLMVESLPFPDTGSRDGLVHSQAEAGLWQRRAARFIAERTGIQLLPSDWAVP